MSSACGGQRKTNRNLADKATDRSPRIRLGGVWNVVEETRPWSREVLEARPEACRPPYR